MIASRPVRVGGGARALAAALLLALGGTAGAETRRALVIGIDRYVPSSRWTGLDGSVNDARLVEGILRSRYGFTEVRLLLDAAATREAILSAIDEVLVGPARPGDVGVLFFAGHGSQVRNSLAAGVEERDRLDETIVPHDGRDIRDVELGERLVAAAAKGLRLTAIFDSCHSGSVSRGLASGKSRLAAPDLSFDAKDPRPRPDPTAAGVLVLTATGPEQPARETTLDGVAHGVLTAALVTTLRSSAPDATAEQLFVRTQALARTLNRGQEVSWEGAAPRLRSPPLGPPGRGGRSRPIVAVAGRVSLPGQGGPALELLGGSAMGLAPGAGLVRERPGRPPIRLTVRAVTGPSRALAVLDGAGRAAIDGISAGDLFEVDRWTSMAPDPLRVHVGPTLPAAELARIARALEPLRRSQAIRWVDDPSAEGATHVLLWSGEAWGLRSGGAFAPIAPDAAALEGRLAAAPREAQLGADRPSLFVRLPASDELAAALSWGRRPGDVTIVEPDERAAHYLLAGRVGARGVEYALVASGEPEPRPQPGPASPACSERSPLPLRTAWLPAGGDPSAIRAAALDLDDRALRIGRARAWLTFSPSPDDGDFPWHLELDLAGKPAGPSVPAGADLSLRLVADAAKLAADGTSRRFVYVLAIDCAGAIQVASPAEGRQAELLPPVGPDVRPGEPIALGTAPLDETRGAYAFVTLVTSERLPSVRMLEQDSVTRSEAPGFADPITGALYSLGRTRGPQAPTRVYWTLQRTQVTAR